MASAQEQPNGTTSHDHAEKADVLYTKDGKPAYDYGGNPLAHARTNASLALPAFGGAFQPGLYKPPSKGLANPAPLGLSAFALTTFILSLINVTTLDITEPNIVVAAAYGYGGLVQLLAGMWEMAAGNTFGATALSSYGGFWIAFAIILTPGGFEIRETLLATTANGMTENHAEKFTNSFALFLFGWFIFTFLLVLCTLKSTVAFFSLFFTLDLAFLLLALGYLYADVNEARTAATPRQPLIIAGGVFGLLAAFLAWYNALAGIADNTNSFFVIPVAHFPWSEKGKQRRGVDDQANAA